MKTLGISCGRKNGNCEVLLKEALMGVRETCASEVEIIRLQELTVKPCVGCEGCVRSLFSGGDGMCVQKHDHMPFLIERLTGAESFILSVPAYDIQVPGLLTMITNRFLGSGKEFMEAVAQKPRIGAIVAVGGTDWTNLALPTAYLSSLMFAMNHLKFVDQMLEPYVGTLGQVVLRDKAIGRARKLGRNVGTAMTLPLDEVRYVGEEAEACPLCHMNLLQIRGNSVVCPICEISGSIRTEGERLKVDFSEEELTKSRWDAWGEKKHIDGMMMDLRESMERAEEIKLKHKDYKAYDCYAKPPAMKSG
jgi:multimeric flavodoxin WrbA